MYTDGGVEDVPGVGSGATAGVGSTSSSVVKSSWSSAERAGAQGGIPRSRVSHPPTGRRIGMTLATTCPSATVAVTESETEIGT